MAKHEANAAKGDLFTTGKKIYEEIDNEGKEKKGKVCDLVVPVITLIICCIIGMIYTGGFFSGTDFVTAFSNSDASVGLALGSIFCTCYYISILRCTKNITV